MKQTVFSTARLKSLSDGVFAIAMTLLILDLKLPPLGLTTDRGVFTADLVAQIPRFISWILSFAILCRLWIINHGLLQYRNDEITEIHDLESRVPRRHRLYSLPNLTLE